MTRKTSAPKAPAIKPPVEAKATKPRGATKTQPVALPRSAAAKPMTGPAGKRAAKKPTESARTAVTPRSQDSKQARLIASLCTASGSTIAQMMALTGWQAHTVRGTLSGVLRKKLGLNVTSTRTPDSGERRYRIIESAAQA